MKILPNVGGPARKSRRLYLRLRATALALRANYFLAGGPDINRRRTLPPMRFAIHDYVTYASQHARSVATSTFGERNT